VGHHRSSGPRMTTLGVMLIVAVLVGIYLLVALLRPERF
jgi:K+-transporting ATPase KdpF subunit